MGVTVGVAPQDDVAVVVPGRIRNAVLVAFFVLTALAGSALSAMVVPMAAKKLVPAYGGSPMVWTTSILFFQITILTGCACAHGAVRLLGPRRRPLVLIPLAISPFLTLPIAVPAWSGARGSGSTELWLLVVLAVVVGAPTVVLAMTGPLVQRWYAWCGLPRSADPYFLYAVGAIGGVLGLMSHPFLIETAVDPATQMRWWAVGYGVVAVLLAGCGLVTRLRAGCWANTPAVADAAPGDRISWRRRMRWTGLAFVPSALMVGVSTRLSITVASVPLVWVIPLAAYLATFAIAFATTRRRRPIRTVVPAAICAAAVPWTVHLLGDRDLGSGILLALILLGGLACHGLLAEDRPEPRRLTEFFLVTAFGAALGGVYDVLISPRIFARGVELPLVVVALAVLPLVRDGRPDADTPRRLPGAAAFVKAFVLAVPLLAAVTYLKFGDGWFLVLAGLGCVPWCVLAVRRPRLMAIGAVSAAVVLVWYQALPVPARQRTFFGDYQVYPNNGWNVLSEGTTMRGYQFPAGPERATPVAYYGKPGPLGDIFAAYGRRAGHIAVIGVGTGAAAAYGRPGQQMDFYEIDPAALDTALTTFTYLNDSKAGISAVLGDGRLRLDKASDGSYGMIIVDASSFATVPPHLLTREALGMYARKLTPGGVLAVHATHGRLVLAPMLRATARAAGLASLTGHGDADARWVYRASTWVAITRSEAALAPLRARAWRWRTPRTPGPVWTDAHASLSGMLTLR